MDEDKRKSLEFIQNVINRMAQCSFLVKGWSITIVSAIFVLAAKDSMVRLAVVPFIPSFMFWVLDGYFLFQERLYRRLYEEAVAGKVSNYSLSASTYVGESRTWLRSMFSKTLLLFYGGLFATIGVALAVLGGCF